MNKRLKEVLTASLNDEKKHLKWLEQIYTQAGRDTADKIAELSSRKDLENIQTIVYQKQYQEAIQKQINDTLDRLHTQSFKGISDYMNTCYQNGYIGAMYDIAGQGIPIIKPIDEVNVLRAIQTDSKLSKGLYNRLGEDIKALKLSIRAEVSRGIIEGSSWNDIASHIAKGMNTPFSKSKNIAMRIARTEGHRIQNEAQMDACTTAKEEGADVLKQWDATLDDRTRESHQMVDGEVRELDEEFSNGLMFPSDPSGDAEEVINCRCALSQRARWALDDDELETLKDRAEYFGLDKSENFEDFKDKYLKLPDDADTMEIEDVISENGVYLTPVDSDDEHYNQLLKTFETNGVEYNAVYNNKTELSEEEIIQTIGGGDRTQGSCASVGLAYIGQKQGWNVQDFRGGKSLASFSDWGTMAELREMSGIKTITASGKTSVTVGNGLLKQVEEGKEYYLVAGQHASIVRRTEGKLQYLELQNEECGWEDFGNARFTLAYRFGCSNIKNPLGAERNFMIDIEDSNFNTPEFKSVLGYLNTSKPKKGWGGYAK